MKKRFTKFYIIGIHSSGNKEEFKFFVDLHTLYVHETIFVFIIHGMFKCKQFSFKMYESENLYRLIFNRYKLQKILYLGYVKVAYSLHFRALSLILPSLPNTAGVADEKSDDKQRYCQPVESRTSSRSGMHLYRAFRFRSQ